MHRVDRKYQLPADKKVCQEVCQTRKQAKKNGPGIIARTILFSFGAADRNRTDMVSLPHDFESCASASSATAALLCTTEGSAEQLTYYQQTGPLSTIIYPP
jgi:hypothetical protein